MKGKMAAEGGSKKNTGVPLSKNALMTLKTREHPRIWYHNYLFTKSFRDALKFSTCLAGSDPFIDSKKVK